MTTASPTRYNSYDDLILDRLDEITKRTEAQLKKLQDNFNETLREMYQAIKQLQSINDPDAQYQKQNENDIHCKLDTRLPVPGLVLLRRLYRDCSPLEHNNNTSLSLQSSL